jgi:hypothetical protein
MFPLAILDAMWWVYEGPIRIRDLELAMAAGYIWQA